MHNGKVSVFSAGEDTGCSFTVKINMKRKISTETGRPSDTDVDPIVGTDVNKGVLKNNFSGKGVLKTSFSGSSKKILLSGRELLRGQSSKLNLALGKSLQGDEVGLYGYNFFLLNLTLTSTITLILFLTSTRGF